MTDNQVIHGENWRITVLGESLVRFEWDPDGMLVDAPTQVISDRPIEPTAVTVAHRDGGIQVITESFQLDWDGGPPSSQGLSVKARGNYHSVWRYGLPMENGFDRITAHRTNLGGTTRTLDTIDGATDVGDGVVSRLGIAVLDDSTSFIVDEDGQLRAPTLGRTDVYVFTHGDDHAAAIRDLHRITGRTPLIPRYAFGNWWSRYHAYTQDEYNELMDRFEAARLPFSVAVIDMDWHITEVDPRFGHGWTGYSWNRDLFPDPAAFLRGLRDRGMAVTLNVHPADGIRAFEDCYEEVCEVLGRDPKDELPVDFDLTDPDFVKAYFEVVHHPLEDMGVDFWWIDWQQGESSRTGADPLWLLNHHHIEDMARRGRRPLILSRYCGPGSHRFPVGFSGDTIATWDSLAFQPWFTATAANIGYGIWSHDIGGHAFGVRDDELALRWLQFGVLSPINRLHSAHDPFLGKEPWKFRPEVADIMGTFLRWRHALVPYLYTEWATGLPIVRPMYHTHGTHPHAYDVDNQYWLGRSLIVAPITSPVDGESRMGAVQVWLPEGDWVDVLTGIRYEGGRMLTMHRPLESVPVLAREGSIIPHAAEGQSPTELPEVIELWIAPGADSRYELVEDDGALDPVTCVTGLTWSDASGTLTIAPADGDTSILPASRTWRVRFIGTDAHPAELGTTAAGESLTWTAPQPIRPGENDVESRSLEIIERAQTAAANKTTLAGIIRGEDDVLRKVVALREAQVRGAVVEEVTRLPESLVGAITELLVARPHC